MFNNRYNLLNKNRFGFVQTFSILIENIISLKLIKSIKLLAGYRFVEAHSVLKYFNSYTNDIFLNFEKKYFFQNKMNPKKLPVLL